MSSINTPASVGAVNVNNAGTYNLVPPTMVNGTSNPLQTDVNGNLKVNLAGQAVTSNLVDQIDGAVGPVFDAAATTINGSGGAFVQLVASLAAACTKIRIADTTGVFLGIYTGAAASEVLAFIINPGLDDYFEYPIAAGVRVSVRAMGASSVTSGNLSMQFAA